ncbi:MAG: septum formation initiator family protein [Clostridiales bacterium]|nr:septum formation initiator family protein [Clostridiales bacterium]
MLGATIFKIVSLNKEKIDTQKHQAELIEEKKTLQKQLDKINDPKNLEEQARDQLRLIKPGEVLYMFPEEMTGD